MPENSTFTLESLKQLRIGDQVLVALTDVNVEVKNVVEVLDLVIDIVICVVYGLAILSCLLILLLFLLYQRQRRKDKNLEWLEAQEQESLVDLEDPLETV
ncbi:unnamed protein product [Bursaphelenchus xylophilus]|uniref:(pine wood nematode) hypothetical protein n=1 Tax=Bursaphelenchus xylophilus TaxID=6326 RepID=A0A1I7SAR5_BURXY|nr:unnamed protein product [Bursaphelenchus xylophilus]CAG9126856.1 unnamed protein product [Bursaphelenchus xylophilus]